LVAAGLTTAGLVVALSAVAAPDVFAGGVVVTGFAAGLVAAVSGVAPPVFAVAGLGAATAGFVVASPPAVCD